MLTYNRQRRALTMREELLKGLSEEQIAKVKECKSQEELLKLAKEEGIELSEEQLDAVSGGVCTYIGPHCPVCDSDDIDWVEKSFESEYTCRKCGHFWKQ